MRGQTSLLTQRKKILATNFAKEEFKDIESQGGDGNGLNLIGRRDTQKVKKH